MFMLICSQRLAVGSAGSLHSQPQNLQLMFSLINIHDSLFCYPNETLMQKLPLKQFKNQMIDDKS